MKLQKLSSLEQKKIKQEFESLLKLIEQLKSILASEQKILDIIKNELLELKEKYGDERRTNFIDIEKDIERGDTVNGNLSNEEVLEEEEDGNLSNEEVLEEEEEKETKDRNTKRKVRMSGNAGYANSSGLNKVSRLIGGGIMDELEAQTLGTERYAGASTAKFNIRSCSALKGNVSFRVKKSPRNETFEIPQICSCSQMVRLH